MPDSRVSDSRLLILVAGFCLTTGFFKALPSFLGELERGRQATLVAIFGEAGALDSKTV